MNRFGLESLVQRGKSPFFKEVESLATQSFAAMKPDVYLRGDQIKDTLKSIKFEDRLKALIIKHMGMPIRRVTVYKDNHLNAKCQIRSSSLFDPKKTVSQHPETGLMINKISKLYDHKLGKFTKDIEEHGNLFCVDLMIATANWNLKGDNLDFLETPEGLTTVIFHELGHADYVLRSISETRWKIINSYDIVDYLSNNPDPLVTEKLLQSIKQSTFIDPSWNKTIQVVERYFKSNPSGNDPEYMEALNTLSMLVAAECAGSTYRDVVNLYANCVDRLETSVHTRDEERSADEFATRHGGGSANIKGLLKVNSLYVGDDFKNYYAMVRGEEASLLVQIQSWYALVWKMPPMDLAMGYDQLNRRMMLIIETAKHAFSDPALPHEEAEEIKADILKAEHYLNQYENTGYAKTRATIKAWKDAMGKFGRIVAFPFQNRLVGDYEKLQDANRSLTRHPLYYLARK